MGNIGILAVQFEPVINNIETNLSKVKDMIEDFVLKNPEKKLDLIVLPEFFTTGVSKTYTNFPFEANGGKPCQFLSLIAKKLKTYIVTGTLVVKEGEKLYNKTFLLDRNGETLAEYKKIHLFKYFGGTENLNITPGENRPIVVPVDFGKLGLSICFDLAYPLHYKKLAQAGAEIVASPSCWAYLSNVEGQKELNQRNFKSMCITRALENCFCFVAVNQAGKSEGSLTNVGHSMMTGPMGEIFAEANEKDETIYAEIDIEYIRKLQAETPIAKEE